MFANLEILPVNQEIADRAVALRQQPRVGLADAIIAATCLIHGRALATRNVTDFAWISELSVINPFQAEGERAPESIP